MAFMGFTMLELRTYLVMMLCWLSIVQVNLMEQPYARSLVVCDTPVDTSPGANFTGSRYCGDRLHVINVGAEINGNGQSLENVGRILATFFVSSFADRGRRRSAIVGQLMLFVSTLLFFLAGFLPLGFSVPIYTVAQGIQGMSGIGILDTIVTGDVALISGDTVGVYNRKNTFLAIMAVFFVPLTLYVQYAEWTDFTPVWLAINALNGVALALILGIFPETKPEASKPAEGTLLEMAAKELQTYRDLVGSNRLVKYRLIEAFMQGMSDPAAIGAPFLMANFGMSQFEALLYGLAPGIILGAVFMPLVPFLSRRFGYRFIWNSCYWTSKAMTFMMVLPFFGIQPMILQWIFGKLPGPLFGMMLGMPFCGWLTMVSAVETRIVGQESNAKYAAMMQLMGFCTGALNSILYTRLFDAEATSTFGKMLPHYVGALGNLLQCPLYYFCHGPLQWDECDRMEVEDKEAAAKAKEAGGATAGEGNAAAGDKKTD